MSFDEINRSRKSFIRQATATSVPVVFWPFDSSTCLCKSSKKPLTIGLAHDAKEQYAASGQSDLRGCIMAIEEANGRGGVLGRKIEYVTQDTVLD